MVTGSNVRRHRSVLGVNVDRERLIAGVVAPSGEVIVRDRVSTPAQDWWRALDGLVRRVLAAVPASSPPLDAVGVSCVGPIDLAAGSANPGGWRFGRSVPVATRLHDLTGLPVYFAGVATASAEIIRRWPTPSLEIEVTSGVPGPSGAGAGSGARAGSGTGAGSGAGARSGSRSADGLLQRSDVGPDHSFAVVHLDGGVDSAVVVRGRHLLGSGGNAGSLAHIVVDPGGKRCWCGALGCATSYLSAGVLEQEMNRPLRRASAAIVERTGIMFGRALASLLAMVDVRTVYVGGHVVDQLDAAMLEVARRELALRSRVPHIAGAELIELVEPTPPLLAAAELAFGAVTEPIVASLS